jgi:hypothetical protein
MANRLTKLVATMVFVAGTSWLATVASARRWRTGSQSRMQFLPAWRSCSSGADGVVAAGGIAADGAGAV